MSETMKAAIIRKYGRAGVLEVAQIDRPIPAPNDLLVKVNTASLNPRDWLTMRGIYQARKTVEPFPITLGSDFSGQVVAVGSAVKSFVVGDKVFGMQPLRGKFGAFAEYVKIDAAAVALRPDDLDDTDAAAMPCAGMTSYQTLHHIAKVRPGETVLVNGASGGVGVYALQIARAMGARVVAVCGPSNAELCRNLGADDVINYREENFEDRRGEFDVVYDVIGRSNPKKCAGALKPGGRYITTIPGLDTAVAAVTSWLASKLLPGKRKSAHLVLVKPHPADLDAMAELIRAGKLRTIVDSRFTLDDIEKAFERSQTWRARGKIIIDIA